MIHINLNVTKSGRSNILKPKKLGSYEPKRTNRKLRIFKQKFIFADARKRKKKNSENYFLYLQMLMILKVDNNFQNKNILFNILFMFLGIYVEFLSYFNH